MKRDTQANSFEAQIAALYDRLLMRAKSSTLTAGITPMTL